MSCARRILCVGSFGTGSLEGSYESAFQLLGCDTRRYDVPHQLEQVARLGAVGRMLDRFLPVVTWSIKANRGLILLAGEWQPEVIVVFGANRVTLGALAQIRAMVDTRIVLVWPDPLAYLDWAPSFDALRLYDLVASYSRAAVPVFESLGARKAVWLPLAGDPALHGRPAPTGRRAPPVADVSFIGGWKAERESVLELVATRLPGVRLKVWGPGWGRRLSRRSPVRRAWQGTALMGPQFADAVASSTISLNPIDPLNHPAANMRFFEIPTAGGFQLASRCPEMEPQFAEGEAAAYYSNEADVPALVAELLRDPDRRHRIAARASQLVSQSHTYRHRAAALLEHLAIDATAAS